MKDSKITMLIASLPLLILLGSCATAKNTYFNDSDRIQSAKAGEGFCKDLGYDCVRMSKGNFRTITSLDPTTGKAFKLVIVYEE